MGKIRSLYTMDMYEWGRDLCSFKPLSLVWLTSSITYKHKAKVLSMALCDPASAHFSNVSHHASPPCFAATTSNPFLLWNLIPLLWDWAPMFSTVCSFPLPFPSPFLPRQEGLLQSSPLAGVEPILFISAQCLACCQALSKWSINICWNKSQLTYTVCQTLH